MPVNLTIPNEFAVAAHGMRQVVSELPMTSIVYLLANGYSQSLGDAATSAIAKTKIAALKVANEQRGKGNAMTATAAAAFLSTDAIVALCNAAATDAKNKRELALLDGTMIFGTRGPNGPRLSPLDAFCRTQAAADAKAMAARKGKPLPKGDDLETLLAAIIDVHRNDYVKRFEQTAVSTSILDSLF